MIEQNLSGSVFPGFTKRSDNSPYTDGFGVEVWRQVSPIVEVSTLEKLYLRVSEDVNGWTNFIRSRRYQEVKGINTLLNCFVGTELYKMPMTEVVSRDVTLDRKFSGRTLYTGLGEIKMRFFQIGFQGKDPRDLN